MNRLLPEAPTAAAFACELTNVRALSIEGADAVDFLHNQLSNDVKALSVGDAQWSTYNSAKGRVLASLRLWRDAAPGDPRFGALIAADLADAIAKRLSMFVLRSKVSIAPYPAALIGIAHAGSTDALRDAGTIVELGDERLVVVANPENASAVRTRIANDIASANEDAWRLYGIESGVPLVTAATSDRFVPQMLNWDLLGAINFRKGCYPGQEIVARMRYLGRLKERLYGFRVAADPPTAGTAIFSPAFGEASCGTVVNAAPLPGGGSAFLAVVQIAAVQHGALTLRGVEGVAMTNVPLPYSIGDAK